MADKTPLQHLAARRRQAVSRLFENKFMAPIRVTVGSATCENAAGANEAYERLQALLEASGRKDVALSRVGCAGRCDMEPVVTVISKNTIPIKYIRMTPEKVERVFESHIVANAPVHEWSMAHLGGVAPTHRVVSLCAGHRCLKGNAEGVEQAFLDALREEKLLEKVMVTKSTCHGLCDAGPVAFVYPDGVMYGGLTPERARTIVTKHFRDGQPVAAYALSPDRLANRSLPIFGDVHFFGHQLRMTLRNCGVIDPESLDEYLGVMGYEALATVLESMSPDAVIQRIKASGLRGRGGGGFSTGMKWQFGASEVSDIKYIVCNADEGDPGAFMDRSTIEGDPHTIIEGMMIGGYAIGANQGYVYIRAEYPLAIERLRKAIADAREAGLLGKNILGSGWSFDIELRLGAGAFVCGEETALIQSIEGHRGMPRPRPPFPTTAGLWGKPTVINNVETFANVPVIILDGAEWFASIGTEKSKGTKVFALAGDVANTGLIEVPMGTSLRDVVFGVGGGMKDGRQFKAVQTGGPAGGCLPESELDTPIDYDTLARAGSIMGSGGMIVMNDGACMVNVAKFFLSFTQDESCGKCTPCREGTKRMLEILTRITDGHGQPDDIDKLLRLAETVRMTSLCGLGQAAPNPVLSTIKHFRAEYEAHIFDRRCPAGVCRGLIQYRIEPDACVGCTACARHCPVNCIAGAPKKVHSIDQARCIRCGRCLEVCKFNAVTRS